MRKQNIAILFGGCSSEYSVSLESAFSVITHLDRNKFTPIMIGISQEGNWYHFHGECERIANNTWCNSRDCTPALFSTDRLTKDLIVFHPEGIKTIAIDAVFPVLHGKNGEDGTVQGLIELTGIPLVGCTTLASALCMDKDRAHQLVYMAGVTVPKSIVLRNGCDRYDLKRKAEQLHYPLFVKPVKAGSSFGITRVREEGELFAAISYAFTYDNEVIIEENINGFEVGCAVMGNQELIVGEIDEIELASGFFDFTEKYTLKTSAIHVPARVTKEKSEEIKQTAKKIYKALGCRGFARVDMFLTPEGRIVFNEVNTIPGFTSHSRFPNMMKAADISFDQILTQVIEMAVRV